MAAFDFTSLFDDIISEGISSIEGDINTDIVTFAESFIFNGEGKLFPTQKALLKSLYGDPLTDDEEQILLDWKAEDRTTYLKSRKYMNLVLEGGRGSCPSEHSNIFTTVGTITYGELRDRLILGERIGIYTLDTDTYSTYITYDIKTWDEGHKPALTLITAKGKEETCTLNHPYLVWRNELPEWVELQDLVPGDTIAVLDNIPLFGNKSIGLDKAKTLGRELGLRGVQVVHRYIPKCIKKAPREEVAAFLSSLFACDEYASISELPSIDITLAFKQFIQDIQTELIKFGISSSIIYKPSKYNDIDAWCLSIQDRESLIRFIKEIDIFSKRDKTLAILHTLAEENSELIKKDMSGGSPVKWDTVVEIKNAGSPRIVGIEVANTNVIGNSIVSHNSKSTLASILVLYEFYKLISLKSPAEHYGLLPNSPIAIFVISQSQEQVKQTLFGAITGYARNSHFFKGLEKSGKIEILSEEIRCREKNIAVYAKHTNSKSLVGYSLKMLVLDEVARFEIDEFGSSRASELWLNVGRACLFTEAFLLSTKGYVSIGKLLEEFDRYNPPEIITYDPEDFSINKTNKVLLWDNGEQEVLEFTTRSGRTESVTLDHPLLVWRNDSIKPEWVEAKYLKINDLVACAKKLNLFNSSSVVSDKEAKLIGYLWGDGGVSQSNNVSFANTTDEIINDFQSILDCEFPGYRLASHNKEKKHDYIIVGNCINDSQPNLFRKRLRDLNLLGIKPKNKRIPECITSGTKSTVANFLNGLFTTDGYIINSTNVYIGISLSSKGLIQDIQRELIRFGIYSFITYRKTKPSLLVTKERDCWILSIRDFNSIEIFCNEIGITFKQHKIQAILTTFKNKGNKTTSEFNLSPKGVNLRIRTSQKRKELKWKTLGLDYHWNRSRPISKKVKKAAVILQDKTLENLTDNYYWEPIKEINNKGPLPTVGIEVVNTGIIGNPIISHNCRRFGREGRKIAISSAWEEGDYIQHLYEVAEKDNTTLAFRLRTWDINLNPDNSEEFLKNTEDYINDPVAAALEYEGIRAPKKGSFMIPSNVKTAIRGASVFDANQYPLEIESAEDIRYYVGVQLSRIEPDLETNSFLHIDYGIKKDSAALALCHAEFIKGKAESEEELSESKWIIVVDGLAVWKPYVDKDQFNNGIKRIVSFLNVEDIVMEICSNRLVTKCSFDQFNSEYMIQKLHLEGVNTELMSTSNKAQLGYFTLLKNLIDQNSIILPRDSTWSSSLEFELVNLIQNPVTGRIDHNGTKSSKDIADAVANAVFNCYSYAVSTGAVFSINTDISSIQSDGINSRVKRVFNPNPYYREGIRNLNKYKKSSPNTYR